MHTVVLSRLAMNRLVQALTKGKLALSLLLGALLGVAGVHAQYREQVAPDSASEPSSISTPDKTDPDQDSLKLQQQMVSRALEFAGELDFESAEQLLEDASRLRESQDLIEDAHETIFGIRAQRIEELRLEAESAVEAGNFSRAERIMIEIIALGGADSTVKQLRRRINEDRVYGGFGPGKVIKDQFLNQDRWTPDSVIIVATLARLNLRPNPRKAMAMNKAIVSAAIGSPMNCNMLFPGRSNIMERVPAKINANGRSKTTSTVENGGGLR